MNARLVEFYERHNAFRREIDAKIGRIHRDDKPVRTRSGSFVHMATGSRTNCGARAAIEVEAADVSPSRLCDKCFPAHLRTAE